MSDSPGKDSFSVFVAGLLRLGVPLEAARCGSGELELRLAGGRAGLVVTASRGGAPPFCAEAGGLVVRYRGQADLDPGSARSLAVIQRLLERLGPDLPDDLESPFALVPGAWPEHAALPFLFPYCTVERASCPGAEAQIAEVLVRVTGRCNQACPFCSAPPPRPDPPAASLARLFARLAERAPGATVTLTGGEPTLRRDLPNLVRRALRARLAVEVQTNATRLTGRGAIEHVAPASGLRFFVSFHAADEATYDQCTGSRGMMPRARAGVRRLLDEGHEVVLSVVVGSLSVDRLVQTVETFASWFDSGPRRPRLHFSITLCPEHNPGAAEHLVRYRALAAALEAAVVRAEALGLPVEPLLSSTHAAIPACLVRPGLRRRAGPPPHHEPGETGPLGSGARWILGPRCGRCAARETCLGVPAPYADRFGVDDLDPDAI